MSGLSANEWVAVLAGAKHLGGSPASVGYTSIGEQFARREESLRATVEGILADRISARIADHEAQIRDLLEEREELLTEIRRLRMGNHPAGRALGCNCHEHPALRPADEAAWGDLREALTERDAEHEGEAGA